MKKLKGFTLIEMIVTIVIIITLSSISVPIYKGYTKQAKMAEAYMLLSAIRDAQMVYYQRYKNFLMYMHSSSGSSVPFTKNDEVLGINARTNKYFKDFCVRNAAGDIKYSCAPLVRKSADLKKRSDDIYFALQFNITLGQKFVDWIDYDSSWN